MRQASVSVVALAIVALQIPSAPADGGAAPESRRYSITEIPRDGFDNISVYDIGNGGHVVGVRTFNDQPQRPWNGFVWTRETGVVDLGGGPVPFAVNTHGIIAGRRYHPVEGFDAFTWSAADGVQLLSSLPGGDAFPPDASSRATGINATGQMIGSVGSATNNPFIRDPDGTVRQLPLPASNGRLPFYYAWTSGISEQGDGMGQAAFSDEREIEYHGVVWRAGGGLELLGDLEGGLIQSATVDMNSLGQILGQGTIGAPGTSTDRAVLWEADGELRDLGALAGMHGSRAGGINDRGEVVGSSLGTAGDRAFLWTPDDGMLNLNELLDSSGRVGS